MAKNLRTDETIKSDWLINMNVPQNSKLGPGMSVYDNVCGEGGGERWGLRWGLLLQHLGKKNT